MSPKIFALNQGSGGSSPGGSSNSFSTIQGDSGTSPTAISSTDTLTFTSPDKTVAVVGNSSTDQIRLSTAAVQSSKVANFNITTAAAEYSIDTSGGGFNGQLPDPTTVIGIPFYFHKTDTGFIPVNIVRFGSEQIDGSTADTTLDTYNEQLCIVSVGSNWRTRSRTYGQAEIGYTCNPGGSVSAPTPSTSIINQATWRRNGRGIDITYILEKITSWSNGSGNIMFPIPNGATWTIDGAVQAISTTVTIGICGYGCVFQASNFNRTTVIMQAYDTHNLAMGHFTTTSLATYANTSFGNTSDTLLTFKAYVPITGLKS